MSGRQRQRGGRRRRPESAERPPDPDGAPPADSSPVVNMFREFAGRLDGKHDRYERLVKKSRDITIESKRIIFMLHRITKDEERQVVLEQADRRLHHLETTTLRDVALELHGHDPYLFMRAISPGLQEYIEALSFYHYLLQEELISWADAQARLTFPGSCSRPATVDSSESASVDAPGEVAIDSPAVPPSDGLAASLKDGPKAQRKLDADKAEPELSVLLPYHEYVLGLADLTGELMRRCISAVSGGQLQLCWRLCALLRSIHEGFVAMGNTGPREVTRKMYTLRQSVAKVENACYQLRVRGEEMPQHMLADVFTADDYPPPADYGCD